MRHIIIPSAKFAPQDLSPFNIPMALYPVDNKPIIDLILNQYNKHDRLYISSFEGHEKIDSYVSKIENCDAIVIDELKDIGYSIYNTLTKIDVKQGDTLVINFADTVIDNNDLSDNAIIYQEPNIISRKWTYLKENKGIIIEVLDKDNQGIGVDDYKLVCGVISIKDPLLFMDILKANSTENGCNFYKSLKEYSEKIPFVFIKEQNWLDLGHPDEYFKSKLAIKSRSFNHMEFDKNRGIIKKTSEDLNKFEGEIQWYIKIPKKLKYVTPRIFDYSTDYSDMFVEMEYYSYPTLLEFYLYGNLDESSWKTILDKIKFVLNDFRQFKIVGENILEAVFDMYYTKTAKRINDLKKNKDFIHFFDKPITVNGVKYQSLDKIMSKLENIVKDNLMDIDEFTVIHGDMCFANILIDDKLNFIKLIDPRGAFGGFDIYGDQRYELAKLFHSVDGKYDYIIKDLFSVEVDDSSIKYQFDDSGIDLYRLMKDSFSSLIGGRLKEIEIIEALLFLSMIPLHNENKNHQYMMLAVGLEILNRWIDIKEN